MKERRPIFYDEERVRWRFTRRTLEISGALLTLLLVYFFVTIVVSVDLRPGLIPDTKSPYRALKVKKKHEDGSRAGRAPSSRSEPRHCALRLRSPACSVLRQLRR